MVDNAGGAGAPGACTRVTLVGAGCGPAGLTQAGMAALDACGFAVGASRLLDDVAVPRGIPCAQAVAPADVVRLLADARARGRSGLCVLLSGDTGFYSGARALTAPLEAAGFAVDVLPGVSSVQLLAARLRRPWQDWALCSAHGMDADPVAQVRRGRPAFFLTGTGGQGPAALCARLVEAGLGDLACTVGERLGYDDERLVTGAARELADRELAPLAVLLCEAAPAPADPAARDAPARVPGLPDEAFVRGEVPMTKQEVRACALAKLGVRADDVCWDVGAGTGSVSVELALHARAVWAVERSAEGCSLVERNRARFGAHNLHLVHGAAPEAIAGLPAPDAVFVGGSAGALEGILDALRAANPQARVCVAAIALETLARATAGLAARGWDVEATQVAVCRTRAAGSLHLLAANNPVFLVTGTPGAAGAVR